MAISYDKASGGKDHGALTGLSDDDHSQYQNDSRANTWLAAKNTDDLAESTTKLYLTVAERADIAASISASDVTYENLDTNGDVGIGVGKVCPGDASELSDSRSPTSHDNTAHSETYLDSAGANTWLTGKNTDDLAESATKFYAIEANATADQTATEIRDALQTLAGVSRLDADYIKNGATNLFANDAVLNAKLPAHITLWHDEATVVVGNVLWYGTNTDNRYNTRTKQEPPAINDKLSWQIQLRPGTYTFYSLGNTDANEGIATWKLDNAIIAAHDWYHAGGETGVTKLTASIAVAGGNYILSSTVLSKNASSSGYLIMGIKHYFIRTGD